MKKNIFLLITLFISKVNLAQNLSPINTDRPDQSDGTYVLPQYKFQIEDGIFSAENNFQNNLMLRFGITKSTEFRLLSDFCKTKNTKGFLPLGVSIKQRLINQNKLIPAITFVSYLRVGQFASKDFLSTENQIDFKFAFQNDLNDKFSLSYNLGTSTSLNHLNYTINLGYSPLDNLSFFGEYFSDLIKKELPSRNFDLGILCLLNEKLQIDIACGSSILLKQNEYYLTTGMSYRF